MEPGTHKRANYTLEYLSDLSGVAIDIIAESGIKDGLFVFDAIWVVTRLFNRPYVCYRQGGDFFVFYKRYNDYFKGVDKP